MAKLNTENEQQKTSGDLRNHNVRGALLSFAERFERLTEEIQAITADRKEVMEEAKSQGFDTKILREAIRRRALLPADRDEHDAVLDLYESALRDAEKAQTAQSQAEAQ